MPLDHYKILPSDFPFLFLDFKPFLTNAPCPEGTHACVPKRHFGVQARTMKILNLISSPLTLPSPARGEGVIGAIF
jgi:hypothetical protein